jgi:hypothetical protein
MQGGAAGQGVSGHGDDQGYEKLRLEMWTWPSSTNALEEQRREAERRRVRNESARILSIAPRRLPT